MCVVYNKAGVPNYVRACYRTGKPGVHVPIADAVWNDNGHLKRFDSARGLKSGKGGEPMCRRCGMPMHICRDECF